MKQTFIGYSTDKTIRHRATSGGVGSALVKYLLDNKIVQYALSFNYDSEHISYVPVLISSFSEYNICGSIYQEMNLISEVKNLLNSAILIPTPKGASVQVGGGKIVLFALPCQARALRAICEKAGFKPIIIGLTCSSQQSHEATSYLLSRIGVEENNVSYLQYRGNGWPSGIQIKTNDGKDYFVKNNDSIWMEIFHSRLFIQPRCFGCRNTLNDFADIVLADPWLPEYVKNEKEGQTLFATYTAIGEELVSSALQNKYIEANEVSNELLFKSQNVTIQRKEAYNSHPTVRNWIRKIFLSNIYKRFVKNRYLFRLHCRLKCRIESRIT